VLRRGDTLRIGPLKFEVMIKVSSDADRQRAQDENDAVGTAGGNANLSTMILEYSKRARTNSAVEAALLPEGDAPTVAIEETLPPGVSVVVLAGLLEGARGTIVKQVAGGYLIALDDQQGEVFAKLPAHLVRPD